MRVGISPGSPHIISLNEILYIRQHFSLKGFIVKIRDWDELEYSDDDTFEKFSHKTKLIRQRKDDTYKAKRKEKLERMEFEENATKGEDQFLSLFFVEKNICRTLLYMI